MNHFKVLIFLSPKIIFHATLCKLLGYIHKNPSKRKDRLIVGKYQETVHS